MNVTDLFVAINIAATSNNPLLSEEVFTAHDPLGEYVFYAASDKRATDNRSDEELGILESFRLKKKLNNPRINLNKAKFLFEVSVYFEEDAYRVASEEIKEMQLDGGDTYALVDGYLNIDKLTVKKYFSKYFPEMNSYMVKGGAGDNWASWINFYKPEAIGGSAGSEHSMNFWYKKIEGKRTLEITAFCKSDDCVIGDMHKHWTSLVEAYKNMPMNHFKGANRY